MRIDFRFPTAALNSFDSKTKKKLTPLLKQTVDRTARRGLHRLVNRIIPQNGLVHTGALKESLYIAKSKPNNKGVRASIFSTVPHSADLIEPRAQSNLSDFDPIQRWAFKRSIPEEFHFAIFRRLQSVGQRPEERKQFLKHTEKYLKQHKVFQVQLARVLKNIK